MEDNLIIEKIVSVYEGKFKPGFGKRYEKRKYDGFCFV